MLKRGIAVLAVALSGLLVVPTTAGADTPLTVLGTDPALDAAPGSDLTELAAGIHGSDLHIQFKFANSIPGIGTYGRPVGIEWAFKSGGKTYLAEAYPETNPTAFGFVLFEIKGGAFEQVAILEGEFDTIGGVLDIFVPLKTIGAKKGSKIVGAGENDVDVHVHAGPATEYTDKMTTTKGVTVR
jgi:hypothetical protein